VKEQKQLNFDEIKSETSMNKGDKQNNITLVLCKIANIANLGIILRTADAASIKQIYLYQSDIDLSSKKLIKTSRSTIKNVKCSKINSIDELKENCEISSYIALEKTSNSIPFDKFYPQKPLTLIVGSETYGISPELLDICDTAIHLPMEGINTSINVAAATSSAIFMIHSKL